MYLHCIYNGVNVADLLSQLLQGQGRFQVVETLEHFVDEGFQVPVRLL
jgi:hypothetical protein